MAVSLGQEVYDYPQGPIPNRRVERGFGDLFSGIFSSNDGKRL